MIVVRGLVRQGGVRGGAILGRMGPQKKNPTETATRTPRCGEIIDHTVQLRIRSMGHRRLLLGAGRGSSL